MEKQKRHLDDRIETYYLIIGGHCSNCKYSVTKVIGSDCTNFSNGDRYHHPASTSAWCWFRCNGCEKCIHDTWVPDEHPKDECKPPVEEKPRPFCQIQSEIDPYNWMDYHCATANLEANIRQIQKIAESTAKMIQKKEKGKLTLDCCYKEIRHFNYYARFMGLGIYNKTYPISSKSRIKQIIAIIDLMAVADKLNKEKHWKPKDKDIVFCFCINGTSGKVHVISCICESASSILFKTRKGADRAYKILGEEKIKTYLGL